MQKLAGDIQWLNLVHYKNSFSGFLGQADGAPFYLSSVGKHDPEAELTETLRQFRALRPPLDAQSVLCRFPARYNWLKEKFTDLNLTPLDECEEFRDFANKLKARSVSLIFSSYFINSPASAFGHTFLRFNSALHRSDDQDQAELLDYGINYAAVMDTTNVLVYAAKSMLGLFPGTFTAVPYYYKVREYNDFESRDLWEYKLNFTQPQIDRMVEHMWELGKTYFDYKFFTENCSYHVLSLMEAGNTDLKLTSKLPALYVIPIDTVRVVVEEPGLVLGSRYRPSVLSRLEKRTAQLAPQELSRIQHLAENPSQASSILLEAKNSRQRADWLDTAVDAFDFLHAKELVYQNKKLNQQRHLLLTERALTDHVSTALNMTPAREFHPENGHLSQRWGLAASYRDQQGSSVSASLRFALHDLLDPLPGQPTFSEIHFAGLTGRLQQTDYGEGTKFLIDNLDVFRVSSFQPISTWQQALSWTAKLGMRTIQDDRCEQCMAANLEAAGGASVGVGESFLALLTKFELDHSDQFARQWQAAGGPEVWGRWVGGKKWSSLAIAGYKWIYDFERSPLARNIFTHSWELRYHDSKELSWALKAQGYDDQTTSAQLGFYQFF